VTGEPEWYERILELQRHQNAERWEAFEEAGLAGQAMRLGFIYLAPSEPAGAELVRFLREATDYDVELHEQRLSEAGAPRWLVVGATQPGFVTFELLDGWVEWMIAAGAAEGPCAFDGWDAQAAGPAVRGEADAGAEPSAN